MAIRLLRRLISWSNYFVWYYKSEQNNYKREFAKELLQLKQLLMEPIDSLLKLPLNIRDILVEERVKQLEEEKKNLD